MLKERMLNIGKPKFWDKETFLSRVDEILESSLWSNNQAFVQELEDFYSDYGVHAAATSNCTTALEMSIRALNLPRGSYVAVPAYTFAATAQAVVNCGLCPVFIDCNKDYCMSVLDLNAKMKIYKLDAVIPTHLFGNLCNIEYFESYWEDAPVIYDAAHCNGMMYKDKPLGWYGTAACFSHHPTKVAGSFELGYVQSKNEEFVKSIKVQRNFGLDPNSTYECEVVSYGTNAKVSEVSAAGALTQLENIDKILDHYKRIHSLYMMYLDNEKYKLISPNNDNSNFGYVIVRILIDEDLNDLVFMLKQYGIEAKRYFSPLNNNPFFLKYLQEGNCPNAEKLYEKTLALPVSLHITESDVAYIAKKLNEY